MSRPSFTFKAPEYRPPAPQVHDDTPLEPYVPEKRPVPVAVPVHKRVNRLPLLTPETLEPPKPAVVYKEVACNTQGTQTEPVVFADDLLNYREYREHRAYTEYFAAEGARKEREAQALAEQERAAEERRLAENEAYMKVFDSPAATEIRAAANKKFLQQHVEQHDKLKLEREQQARQKLPQLRRPPTPGNPATRTRNYNANNRAAGK
jgi:hypothetical protein